MYKNSVLYPEHERKNFRGLELKAVLAISSDSFVMIRPIVITFSLPITEGKIKHTSDFFKFLFSNRRRVIQVESCTAG